MIRRRRVIQLVAATGMASIGYGCSGPGSGGSAGLTTISEDGVVQQSPPGQRRQLPRISGETLDGGFFDSETSPAQILLINLWGSWCAPCRKEAPALRATWEKYRSRSVQFVGVGVKDNDASAVAFEESFGIEYPSIRSGDSAAAVLALNSVLPRAGVPSTVITDRSRRVAVRIVGATTEATLDGLLADLLRERPPA